jgi:hypothetical protein
MTNRPHAINTILIIPLALISLLIVSGSSSASPLLMGRIASVHPYGAQDASRNPALLVWQQQENEIGLLADYQTNVSTAINNLNSDAIADVNVNNYALSPRLSYIYNKNKWAVGCDINTDYNMLQNHTQFYTKLVGFDTLGQNLINNNSLSTLCTISAGRALNSHNSVGIQLNAGYSKNSYNNNTGTDTNKNKTLIFTTPLNVAYETNTVTLEQITVNPGIGYLGKIENSEIGLIFTAGRLLWEQDTEKKQSVNTISVNSNVLTKKKLPFSFMYSLGPGLIAGSFSRLDDIVAIGLELGMTFPVRYKYLSLEQIGDQYPFNGFLKSGNLQLDNKISNYPFVALRGGFEFLMTSYAVLSLGGGLNSGNILSRSRGGLAPPVLRNNQKYQKLLSIYGTAGIDFLMGRRTIITVGTVLSHNSLSIEEIKYQQIPPNNLVLHRVDSKIKVFTVDMFVALSFGF